MSELSYRFQISETFDGPDGFPEKDVEIDLPHFDAIAEWLPKEWDGCAINETFDGPIGGKVEKTSLTVRRDANGKAWGYVKATFAKGFRLSEAKRESFWDQMDAQMTDGFGESMDRRPIPGTEPGWRLSV